MSSKASYEIVTTTLGATSLKDLATGEILHNPVGPWAEANDLYMAATDLISRMSAPNQNPLTVFDVGLGAGFNAVTTLHHYREKAANKSDGKKIRPLKMISFEKDLGLFKFALENSEVFPFFEPHLKALKTFAENGGFHDENFSWELRLGPFEKTIQDETETPEVIFFEPYSPKTNPEMWQYPNARKLHDLAEKSQQPCVLATYSVATPIRMTFLMAGFFVGSGPRSGMKHETTVAATSMDLLQQPLGSRWLERWSRSSDPHPLGMAVEPVENLKNRLLAHPQFRGNIF